MNYTAVKFLLADGSLGKVRVVPAHVVALLSADNDNQTTIMLSSGRSITVLGSIADVSGELGV